MCGMQIVNPNKMADIELSISINLPSSVIKHGAELGLSYEEICEECESQLEHFIYKEIEMQQDYLKDSLIETLTDLKTEE